MKSQLRIAFSTLSVLLMSAVGVYAGSRPITISDGSVCLADMGQAVPDTPDREYQGQFQVSKAYLETFVGDPTPAMKDCLPIETDTEADCKNCEVFENVRSVVVQFRDGTAIRNVAMDFDAGILKVNTVDLRLQDWRPHGPPTDRKKVKRDGLGIRMHKIQWIFVNGAPRDCRTTVCRITIQNADTVQAQ